MCTPWYCTVLYLITSKFANSSAQILPPNSNIWYWAVLSILEFGGRICQYGLLYSTDRPFTWTKSADQSLQGLPCTVQSGLYHPSVCQPGKPYTEYSILQYSTVQYLVILYFQLQWLDTCYSNLTLPLLVSRRHVGGLSVSVISGTPIFHLQCFVAISSCVPGNDVRAFWLPRIVEFSTCWFHIIGLAGGEHLSARFDKSTRMNEIGKRYDVFCPTELRVLIRGWLVAAATPAAIIGFPVQYCVQIKDKTALLCQIGKPYLYNVLYFVWHCWWHQLDVQRTS